MTKLKERLKRALGPLTEEERTKIHEHEVVREEQIFAKLYSEQKAPPTQHHRSFNSIPKFYFALPKEHEIIKVSFGDWFSKVQ